MVKCDARSKGCNICNFILDINKHNRQTCLIIHYLVLRILQRKVQALQFILQECTFTDGGMKVDKPILSH